MFKVSLKKIHLWEMLKWSSFQELLCPCPCPGGPSEQAGVEAPESRAEREGVGWPQQGWPQGQSCSGWLRSSSAAEQGLKAQRRGYVVGTLPPRGVWGISVALLLPSHPLYCCAIEGLTLWSFLRPGGTSDFLKHGPKSSHVPLSVVVFRLEFASGNVRFLKLFYFVAI